jgi:hypothetical protein
VSTFVDSGVSRGQLTVKNGLRREIKRNAKIEKKKKQNFRIVDVPTEIRTRHLSNANASITAYDKLMG